MRFCQKKTKQKNAEKRTCNAANISFCQSGNNQHAEDINGNDVCVVKPEVKKKETYEQLTLFTDIEAEEERKKEEKAALLKERKAQETVLAIRKKFGKNAILKGTNLEEGATTIDRNRQIGGHKA